MSAPKVRSFITKIVELCKALGAEPKARRRVKSDAIKLKNVRG
jgi:hypothetical protein